MAQMIVNGVAYDMAPNIESYEARIGDFMEIRVKPPQMRPHNQCSHCGRATWLEAVASSWEEAVEWGWFTPVEAT